ncbi:FG-GAP repeat domain-containing protein [Streptomyces sp. 3214.6]|uniref:FG-GAP repeat domain-containing protein n=1 Tax=Streptomyces sp. 3214.6 TaxID=1882757 RepID=UPI000909B081|nr:VCBS repeat-containing protein [Streptomyces sp. 3214.6]SHI16818.1 Repeat domain-containing protein [Streptomyces sp. 3214.6]
MARHVSARLRLVAASAVLAAGLSPLLSSNAVADTPQETVVPAALRDAYTEGAIYGGLELYGEHEAGTQGVFHTLEGSGLVWTRYSDGTSTKVVKPTGYDRWGATSGDALAFFYYGDGHPDRVQLWNAADGTTRTIQAPSEDIQVMAAYDDLAVAEKRVTDGTTEGWEKHLLFPNDDGTTRDVPVTGVPEGVQLGDPLGGKTDVLFFGAEKDGKFLSVQVDRRTGQATGWTPPLAEKYSYAHVTDDHLVLYNLRDSVVLVYDAAKLSAGPVEVAPGGGSFSANAGNFALVGDWILHQPKGTGPVIAKPLAGGPAVTLLTSSYMNMANVSDGTAVVVGRTSDTNDDWGVQRIQPGPDGVPAVTQVKALPKPPLKIQGVSLDHGLLVVTDQESPVAGGGWRTTRERTVAPTGVPAFGESSIFLNGGTVGNCAAGDVTCSSIWGAADGELVWLEHDPETNSDRLSSAGSGYPIRERKVPAGGRITDVSGRYVIYTTATQQSVYRIASTSAATVTRAPGAAALSGDTLWTPGATPGTLTAYDLTARKTSETVTTDAGCTPTDLEALGRWIYWTCDGRAGVYDRAAGRSVPVPADEAALGDGYVVTHDKQAGKLVLTTVADGTPASRVIGDLPDTGVSQRGVRWTVDESGANAAYVDAQERVHLAPSGVAQQPLRQLEPAQSVTQTSPGTRTLTSVLLSKPAAGWSLEVRSRATGKHVGGTDGGAVRGALNVNWNATDPSGVKPLPNGFYDWTVTVSPADGVGAPLQVRGTVRVVNGSAAFHDYVGPGAKPDGAGDLLTMPASGTLTYQQGTGQGTFSGQVSGSGWPTGIKAVPIGDLSGDRCNDVLVRLSSGALRLYRTGCGGAVRPTSPYTTLGTSGWTQFDVLTSPGDLTQDGRPDLIARNPSTGKVYMYKGTAAGKLAAPVKLYDNWKSYKKIIGVGDLNGDGIGDLLVQDTSNNLYRYLGKGNGTFSARVKLFASWGGSYNAVTGVGDITGDGKADLVARDTAGGLYRIPGTGTGTFGPTIKIGAGWQNYKGIF